MTTCGPFTDAITQGDRYELRLVLRRDGSPYDPVDDSLVPRMELRTASGTLVATFTITATAQAHVYSVVLPATTTAGLAVGSYASRLLLQHTSDPDLDQITKRKYTFFVETSATQRV